MKFPLSFGKIEIKYFLMMGISLALIFVGRQYTLYSDEKEKILGITENKLLKSLVKYIGFSLMIIGDIIIKILSSRKGKKFNKNL